MTDKAKKWVLTHNSHDLKVGDVYEGTDLPLWLHGKASPLSETVFEVATPDGMAKLQSDLDAANDQVTELSGANAKLQSDLDAAQKQIAELQKKAK